MKNILKMIIVFTLSFLSVFYDFNGINVLLTIPLLAFFMFNGLQAFLISLFGLLSGSLTYYLLNHSYIGSLFLLIGLCFYFLIYHLSLLFHKKLIINFFTSNILAINGAYLFYILTTQNFNGTHFVINLLLSSIICFAFSYLLKYFSFYLLSMHNENTLLILFTLCILYTANINFIYPHILSTYIALFACL